MSNYWKSRLSKKNSFNHIAVKKQGFLGVRKDFIHLLQLGKINDSTYINLWLKVNGDIKQKGNKKDMLFMLVQS
ncbi:hypothetical protein Glove_177g115 [Diversispora epigaea]|uniref:Uncharacterized protein n=1 Tax=Diversispora epigaea TaxID=1348612 RepID=A0A397IUQ5_9GLOM|nr:hypothetical protein Glove_177g115 [Diversispora epigaea]